MATICAYCEEVIQDKGIIRKGNPYHKNCQAEQRSADWDNLRSVFSEVHAEILSELYERFDENTSTLKDLLLDNNWCIITEDILHGIRVNTFYHKSSAFDWLAKQIFIAMSKEYAWNILYILHKGSVVTGPDLNNFKISVSV